MKIFFDYCFSKIRVLVLIFFMTLISCRGDRPGQVTIDRSNILNTITMKTDLVIGLEDQPAEHQLGQPIAVRTDAEGNIYIADRASKFIKVYNRDGSYLRSLGSRGRGPGEFQEMEFMERTPDGHLVLMDRVNMLYTVISTEGESVEAFPYNFSNQFYPSQIQYVDGKLLALFLDHNPRSDIPKFERNLFHVYSTDFQEPIYSFFPTHTLGIEGEYAWEEIMISPGLFTLSEDKNQFVYSPGIYDGKLYLYEKKESGQWSFNRIIQGILPSEISYETFSTETEFEMSRHLPGATILYSAGGPHMGRVVSLNAGIFRLGDGRIVHFWGERRENEDFGAEEYHFLDFYVQIFKEDGNLEGYGEVYAMKQPHPFRIWNYSLVSWKDDDDNFYMIEESFDAVPVIRRFTLEQID